MECPACGSTRVYLSKSRGKVEKTLHAILPIHFYRCHACNWRKPRFRKRALNIVIVSVLGLLFGFLLFELASPIVKLMLHLILS